MKTSIIVSLHKTLSISSSKRIGLGAFVSVHKDKAILGTGPTSSSGDQTAVIFEYSSDDQRWSKVKELATGKSTFFGVGAGHLGGDIGVVNLLKEAGYTITPIL